MRSLLDSNVLIALLDNAHSFNERVFDWFLENHDRGWATCPITENAALRVLTNPGYRTVDRYSLSDLRTLLSFNIEKGNHEFWPDDISILDKNLIKTEHIFGPKQLTDVYLLALAVKNHGRLVTLDERISVAAVVGATDDNLYII